MSSDWEKIFLLSIELYGNLCFKIYYSYLLSQDPQGHLFHLYKPEALHNIWTYTIQSCDLPPSDQFILELTFFCNRLPYIWDPIIETNSYLLIDNDNQIWPSLIFLEAKKIYCLQEKFTTILTKSCVTGQIIPYCSFLSWLTPQKQILINISIVFLNSIALLCGIIAYAFEKLQWLLTHFSAVQTLNRP